MRKTSNIETKYPSLKFLEERARKRIPDISWDYLAGGGIQETGLVRNRESFSRYTLTPRYLTKTRFEPSTKKILLGQEFDCPFGVAPIGLTGLIWPRSGEYLSVAAERYNVPFCLSLFATTSLETIAELCGAEHRWFQHYPQNSREIDRAILHRAVESGYRTLVLTVDVPTTRKVRELRRGLSLPLKLGPKTLWDIAKRPSWALASIRAGIPRFENWIPHLPDNYSVRQMPQFLADLPILPHQTLVDDLAWFRENWKGRLIVKGILHHADASKCREVGADAIVVSNHGGRQLDEAPAAILMIPKIRETVGHDYPLLVDGGIRHGGQIAVALAMGADFVLLGRAFMLAVAALGQPGASHAMDLLKSELQATLIQIGCQRLDQLPDFLSIKE